MYLFELYLIFGALISKNSKLTIELQNLILGILKGELSSDLQNSSKINLNFDYNTFTFSVAKNIHKYVITGTKADNYIPKDNFKRNNRVLEQNNNFTLISIRGKHYQIGFSSFLNQLNKHQAINKSNFIDYYGRFISFNDRDLSKELNRTFKDRNVFKMNLNTLDIEKLNKKYLLRKNDLKLNEYRFNFIYLDEFLLNVKIQANYHIYSQLIDYEAFFYQNYKNKSVLKNLIIIGEKLNYDNKSVFIYCNSNTYNILRQTLKKNHLEFFKRKNNKLLRLIKQYRYEFEDFDEIYLNLKSQLNKKKSEFKRLNKKSDFLLSEVKILSNSSNKPQKLLEKRNKQLNQVLSEMSNLELDLIDINNQLIDVDKKKDNIENNMIGEKCNYSLKLKTYL